MPMKAMRGEVYKFHTFRITLHTVRITEKEAAV
jgi:hypothetical protein